MSEVLAEVRVAVIPDASTFGALLAAEIAAASRTVPPVVVPVQVAATSTASITQAVAQQTQLATATAAVGASAGTSATATARLSDETREQARAARALALSQEEVLNATTEIGRLQVTATRSAAALAAARRAEALITRDMSAAQVQATVNTLALAEAQNLEAQSALRAATAQQRHAVSLSQLGRGAGATGLSLLGVRGATLAANGAFLAGAAAVATFAKGIQLATNFTSQMAVFGVTTEATADQVEQAADAAREFGRDLSLPGVNAVDAAEAMTEFARAGLSVQDSIAATRGGLQLATAAQLSNADAVELTAGALNAFGLAGSEAVRVADLLANAANLAQGGIGEMGLALRQSAGVARQVGISLDDTVALLTLLARNGLQGSDAGTALRTSLIRLINPTKEARNVLSDLNVELRDQQGNIRPEIFADFAAAQRNLSRSQQDANAAIVFGQDAIRALAIAGREGRKGLDEVREGVEKQGTAAEVASARNVGLAGAAENVKNQFAALGQDLGETTDGPLTDFLNIVAGGLKNLNDFSNFLDELAAQGDDTKQTFAELAEETGRYNRAVAAREGRAGEGLLAKTAELNQALKDQLGPGVAATEMIEGYRQALSDAAAASEGLANRIDESTDRFAQPIPSPAAPRGPKPIGPAARLDSAIDIARAEGDLDEVERLQRIALERAKRAFQNSRGNVAQRTKLFQDMKSAEADLLTTQRQITEESATEARKNAEATKRAQQDADQAVLDSVDDRLSRNTSQEIIAQSTKRLSDDIRVARARREILEQSVATVRRSVEDAKTRKEEIAQLTRELTQTNVEIAELTAQAAENEAQRIEDAQNSITESLEKQTRLAELRGDDAAVLKALDRQIADARKRVARAKKAKQGVLDEQIALQELINQRKELIDTVKSGSDGTSIADFLTSNTELFKSIAPNFGTAGVDPLSGFDFSKSVVAGLTRMQQAVRTQAGGGLTSPQKPILDPQIDRLIAALDRNTDATNGNTTSGGAGFNLQRYETVTGQRAQAMGRFWEAANARRLEDDRASGGI